MGRLSAVANVLSSLATVAAQAPTVSAIVLALAICGDVKAAPAQAHDPDSASTNIYAATGKNALAPAAAHARPLVYVPNSRSATVTVIDPVTYRVIRSFSTGALPQHVVPSYDLDTLWVANNEGNSLTPIDPATGEAGTRVPVDDPYNLYFTPDGRFAMVVAERLDRIDFRDARDMKLVQSLPLQCKGVDHMEFTSDGRYAIATCEFSGQLVKIDLAERAVVGYLKLGTIVSNPFKKLTALFGGRHGDHATAPMPQDIRSSPDGGMFYVADMKGGGVVLVDPIAFLRIGFIKTGIGAHGLYPSRDGTSLYVTNRGWSTTAGGRHGPGSISVLDFSTRRIVENWPVPGGGSPDMGNVTADGSELWVSGRYDDEVYVFATATGTLTHRIPVGREPHGLCVWPQPGRFSLGHTGNMR
jgi:YVTN family beta-propeller protein